MSNTLILKFEKSAEQVFGSVKRIVGLVTGRSLIKLIDNVGLSANPRSAKTGSVTSEIVSSLEQSPDLFPFMTKGILIGTANYAELERQRYKLTFDDSDVEGVLDGGHNTLAVAIHILKESGVGEREIKTIRTWDDLKLVWQKYRSEVDYSKENLNFVVPVELLVPINIKDIDSVEQFNTSLLDICAARNNNVQLTEETKANKKGFYDDMRGFLPEDLEHQVEWKTNDGGRIKVRDLVALSWVPLSILDLPANVKFNPVQIYRSKAACTSSFNRLMADSSITKVIDGGYSHELHHRGVKSAFKILGSMPNLYDQLYKDLPESYNKAGGNFGRISSVKMYDASKSTEKNPKYLKSQPTTPYYKIPVNYTCPDGFLVPLLYGLRALLKAKDDMIVWKVDPSTFLSNHLIEIMKSYKLVIEMAGWDPQRVGKNMSAYDFAESAIQAQLIKSK